MIPVLEDIIRGLLNGTMTPEQAKFYLTQHEQLQGEAKACSDVPFARARCVVDLLVKCDEQDTRWGKRSYPSFDTQLVASADTTSFDLAGHHEVPNARRARLTTSARGSELTWMDILVEEVAKTTEKYENQAELREQLIDVAGVAIQWASQLTPDPELVVFTKDHDNDTTTFTAYVEADHEGPNLR